ncbi:MAG TPA: hypothetical protein VGM29_03640 [Polyangiaceae bacterium]|jgi:hypothetical protein
MSTLARAASLFSLLALSAACGSNTPKIPPELLAGGGCTAPEYPNGPFGAETGQVLANACFQGFRQPAQESHDPSSLETLAFSDYYDPTGSRGVKLILIDTAAIWCSACRTEHQTLSAKNDQYSPLGLRILGTLFQDAARNPASPDNLKTWVETFDSDYAMALDPDYQMGSYAPAETAPLNLVVDARTMTIELKQLGDQDSVLWPFIDAALAQ